jgi:hypothetical protein
MDGEKLSGGLGDRGSAPDLRSVPPQSLMVRRESAVSATWRRVLKTFEGARVHLALTDGRRVDDCQLMSVTPSNVWVFSNGSDLFIPVQDVAEVWEACGRRPAPAVDRRWVA